jgi:enoyl-CoA hydratase/carnithine racemase
MTAGCTGALRGGILYLTLDTRASSVNVLTSAVAAELERELEAGLAAGARAVVIRSAKRGSFINGAQLLLAASTRPDGPGAQRGSVLRRSYAALAAAPVPTIAVVEGNCYGCGLELALTCDYRIAADSYDTHFYMTELRDYAIIPFFGGTQRLPRLLGLRTAMDVLLGERVDARRALRIGLVDRLAPAASVTAKVRSFLASLRARKWPKRSSFPSRASSAPDFARLPGPERPLAREYLRLARLPFTHGYEMEEGLREETASFWRTNASDEARHAMSFFFVRQAAKAHAIGSASYERPRRLALSVREDNPSLRKLARILSGRRLPGIELKRAGALAFAAAKVPGAFTCVLGVGPRSDGDCAAFLPLPDQPIPVIELVPAAEERPWRPGVALFQVLEQAGFAPVVTRAQDRFVSQRLIDAFRNAAGSDPARQALLEFGYRLPQALARRLRQGGSGSGIAERVSEALASECIRALDEGALTHPAQADLLAHLLFGFPVTRGGLLRHAASGRSGVAPDAARVLSRLQR